MQFAEIYTRANQLQFSEAKNFLDACTSNGLIAFKDGEQILDVGCGPGDVTSFLLRPLLPPDANLIGVDLSQEMVDYALNNFSDANVHFKQANIEDKNVVTVLGRGKFDKIFSFHCLQWINDQRLAFENLNSLLNAGGSIYLIFIAASKMNDLNDRLICHPRWQKYLKVLDDFSPKLTIKGDVEEFFTSLLKELNFSVSECRLVESEYTFKNMQHLCDLIKVLHPSIKEMSPEVMQSFIDDIQRIIIKDNLADVNPVTGQITAQHQIFKIIARKRL